MNRYPLWKYLIIAVALVVGVLYSLPNLFGESPAVQVSAAKPTVKVELATQARVEKILADASIPSTGMFFERTGNVGSVKVRFDSTDIQLRAKDLLQQKLNSDPNDPSFTVALNLLSNTPHWLSSINAMPMPLGLDLRLDLGQQVGQHLRIDVRAEEENSTVPDMVAAGDHLLGAFAVGFFTVVALPTIP